MGLVAKVNRMPAWGETMLGAGFREGPGGKGSNQAVAAARLGGQVDIIACIGRDKYGEDAMSMLRSENIGVEKIKRTENVQTGVGFVFVNASGENCIIVDPGANLCLSTKDIKRLSNSIMTADILLVQLECDIRTIRTAVEIAKSAGKTVILNPAPAVEHIHDLLPYTSILTPNESELKLLCGLSLASHLTEQNCVDCAQQLLNHGTETVVVTRGEQGALLVTGDQVIPVPAPKVNPVDTTGAGDAFNGALAVALSEEYTYREAVEFACYAGAFSVTGNEVIPSLPTRAQLEEFKARNTALNP